MYGQTLIAFMIFALLAVPLQAEQPTPQEVIEGARQFRVQNIQAASDVYRTAMAQADDAMRNALESSLNLAKRQMDEPRVRSLSASLETLKAGKQLSAQESDPVVGQMLGRRDAAMAAAQRRFEAAVVQANANLQNTYTNMIARLRGQEDAEAQAYADELAEELEAILAEEVNPLEGASARPSRRQRLQQSIPLWSPQAAAWVAGGRQYFVSPEGSATGSGSPNAPWDLRSVLQGRQNVQGGDVVWVMEGVYRGCFTVNVSGYPGRPVVIRAVPGARVVIDSSDRSGRYALEIAASWCVIWGLEVTNSDASVDGPGSTHYNGTTQRPSGYHLVGPNSKIINCHIHSTAGGGFWSPAIDSEIYGTILQNMGAQRRGRGQGDGHNIYTQNEQGTKLIRDNIIFNGFRNGIQAYTQQGRIEGYAIIGNTVFGASASAIEGDRKMDLLVGGTQHAARRILIQENMFWSNGLGRSVQLGYGVPNEDLTFVNNYVAGRVDFVRPWSRITMTGNHFFAQVSGIDRNRYSDNYYGSPPNRAQVFIRPNLYEPGRANITVYNWGDANTVEVDISGVVPVGAEIEIRNAQNWHRGPIGRGVYRGQALRLPMAGLEPAQPVGGQGFIRPNEMTGRRFNVFVLMAWNPGTRRGTVTQELEMPAADASD